MKMLEGRAFEDYWEQACDNRNDLGGDAETRVAVLERRIDGLCDLVWMLVDHLREEDAKKGE
jgi:hypothetical protein